MTPLPATATLSSLLDIVHQIEPVIRTHAADAERDRHLSDAAVAAMRTARLYQLWRPRALGGLEVDVITGFRVIEEMSRIDSAAGWNLQLSNAIDSLGAWFPDDGAKEIFGKPDAIFGGAFFPPRRAVAVDGGYRITGTTPFVSGAHQAKWYLGLAHVHDGDAPRLGQDGAPVTLLTMCPASEAVLISNWQTLGMRGTGSHDVSMADVLVPLRHTAVLAPYERPGSAYQGPLYKLTVWPAIAVLAPVALGIARAALDELVALATTKTPSYLATRLAERISVQAVVGEAEARLGSVRAYLYEALREPCDKALEGHLIDMAGKMKLQLAATHAVVETARIVDLVHSVAGTTAIREQHTLQRHFRDAHTITQHAYVSASRYESGGQYFLGVPIEWPFYGL
jgi:alkylation response protein AidB-like acyl-CoA dehydrogenase